MKFQKLAYPAIFYPWDDGSGYTVEVPDLPGCISEGDTLAEAVFMGIDAASGWVLTELEEGKPAPEASRIETVRPEAGGFVSMLALDIAAYYEREKGSDLCCYLSDMSIILNY
jgi:predicted RNase H-like HicB family nuclease